MNFLKKTQKAILLPEALKIIIGVLCIVLLLYLAFSLYGIFSQRTKLEEAKATLDAIEGKINALETMKDGETLDYLITGPKGWRMVPFEKELCICPEAKKATEQKQVCSSEGICRKLKYNIKLKGTSITCEAPIGWHGRNEDLENCFSLLDVPKALYINLEKSIIYFSSDVPLVPINGNLWTDSNKDGTYEWEQVKINLMKTSEGTFIIDLDPYIQLTSKGLQAQAEQAIKRGPYFYLKKRKEIEIWLVFNLDDYKVGKIDSEGYLWIAYEYLSLLDYFKFSDEFKLIEPEKNKETYQEHPLIPDSPDITIYKSNLNINYQELLQILK